MRRLLLLPVLLLCLTSYAGTGRVYPPAGGATLCLVPSGDSSTSGWSVTGGGGTHRDCVDEAPLESCLYSTTHDSDTTRLQCPASTVCNDTLDVTNTSGLSGKTILFVTYVAVCKENSVPTNGNITVSIIEGGTTTLMGTSSGCSGVSYSDRSANTRLFTNPRTGVAWTSSDLDGAQLKLERASLTGTVELTAINLVVVYETTEVFGAGRTRSGGGS